MIKDDYTYQTPDYRTKDIGWHTDAWGSRVHFILCEELIEGRWESFIASK